MGRKRTRAWKYIYFCITGLIFLSLFNCVVLTEIKLRREAREYLLRGNHLLAQRDYESALKEYQKVIEMSTRTREAAEALFKTGLIYAHFGYFKKNYEASLNSFIKVVNDYPESPLVEQARIWVGVLQEHKRIDQIVEKLKQAAKVSEQPIQPAKVSEKSKPSETKRGEPDPVWEYLLRGQKFLAQGNYEGAVNENQKVLSMVPYRPPADEALFNLGVIYAHPGNPKKDFEKSLNLFTELMNGYPESRLVEQAKIWVEVLQENKELNQMIQKLKQVDIEIEERKREQAK